MRELKVGDRVWIVVKQGDELPVGATGTVMSLDNPAVKLAGGVGKACIFRSDKPYRTGSGDFCSSWVVSFHDLSFWDNFRPGDRVKLRRDHHGLGLPKDAVGTVISCEPRATGQQYCVVAMDETYYRSEISVFDNKFPIPSGELEYVYRPVHEKLEPAIKARRLILRRQKR